MLSLQVVYRQTDRQTKNTVQARILKYNELERSILWFVSLVLFVDYCTFVTVECEFVSFTLIYKNDLSIVIMVCTII